jgi:hypothetical protein
MSKKLGRTERKTSLNNGFINLYWKGYKVYIATALLMLEVLWEK